MQQRIGKNVNFGEIIIDMSSIQVLRKEVKKYIDKADENTLKMMYAMLEVQQEENDWWDDLPEELQQKIDAGIKDIKSGKAISHEEVIKKYKKWFAK